MKKRILLAEQHLRRGVDANVLIAAHLKNMGIETRLTLTGSQLCSHLVRFEPHVVYYPWVTPYVSRFLRRRQKSVPIVNAYQEQKNILHKSDTYMAEWASMSDYIFAWGDKHKREFEQLFDGPTVILTGNPRFDPYFDSSIAESLYASREELACKYGLPRDKDWVLLTLGFATLLQSKERIKELMQRGDLTITEIETKRLMYKTLSKWVSKFSEEVRDTVLIVRPHPGSDIDRIKNDFGGRSQSVRYINGGGIPPWIMAADRYVTQVSTSIMEAWITDTPTALVKKSKRIENGETRSHLIEADTSLETYSEFQDFLTSGVTEGSWDQHHDFLASHYRLDGQSAFRTADKLRQIASQQGETVDFVGGRIENLTEHAKFIAKKFLIESGLNRLNPFDRPNDEFLSQAEVQRTVETVGAQLNLADQDDC